MKLQPSTHRHKKTKNILNIHWQRLITKGKTCPRCGSTETELEKAIPQLKKALKPLGITVVFKKSELTLGEFKKNPIQSNRILFNGTLLEDLIRAKTGQSQCCEACGDEACRTVEIDGKLHEIIPADVIVRAGLIAATRCTNRT